MLYCLGGLTSTEDNFAQKAGAASRAAQYGLALVFPDTSPRNVSVHLTVFFFASIRCWQMRSF